MKSLKRTQKEYHSKVSSILIGKGLKVEHLSEDVDIFYPIDESHAEDVIDHLLLIGFSLIETKGVKRAYPKTVTIACDLGLKFLAYSSEIISIIDTIREEDYESMAMYEASIAFKDGKFFFYPDMVLVLRLDDSKC